MVIGELAREIRGELHENAAFEANEIVMKALGITRTELILKAKDSVSEEAASAARAMAARRINGEPLQYILGETEFMSLPFKVNRSTLIPRSDTETLVEYVLKRMSGNSQEILDIGAGTGCVGISLAYYRKSARVTELDISVGALETAKENAELNGVSDRISFKRTDILSEIPDGKYDIIVSNPPYIKTGVIGTLQTEVKDYEPLSALDGGGDGLLFYRRIISIAPKILKNGGMLAFEIGFDQAADVSALMKDAGFERVEVFRDLCGNDRICAGINAVGLSSSLY